MRGFKIGDKVRVLRNESDDFDYSRAFNYTLGRPYCVGDICEVTDITYNGFYIQLDDQFSGWINGDDVELVK